MERSTQISITKRLNSFLHYHNAHLDNSAGLRQLTDAIDANYTRIRRLLNNKERFTNPVTLSRIVGYYGWDPIDFLSAPDCVVDVWRTEQVAATVNVPINQHGLKRTLSDGVSAVLRKPRIVKDPTSFHPSNNQTINGRVVRQFATIQ